MTAGRPPVVVGVDDGAAMPAVARTAAEVAHRELRPLVLVTAVEHAPDAGRAQGGPWHRALLRLATLREDLLPLVPALTVRTVVRAGSAVEVLCEESSRSALLVIGTGNDSTGLGPVARALVRTAGGPLLLVPPHAGNGTDVVAGVDGSPGTTTVLAAAAQEAGTRGRPLRIVHTWHRRPGTTASDPRWAAAVASAVAGAERRLVDLQAGHVREGWPAVAVTEDVRPGDATQALLGLSRGAALVVVGQARTAAGRVVVETVAAAGRCPVLVVPRPPVERGADAPRGAAVALGR
ncbi:universal stress protein [Geodermatophilus sp. FMUSA9-8]|uniref:universal stress protein n=1 Tax=Geodermatophilus sp. FMUSA9-8 TaxID=3120155 RepID=UPI003009EF4E